MGDRHPKKEKKEHLVVTSNYSFCLDYNYLNLTNEVKYFNILKISQRYLFVKHSL